MENNMQKLLELKSQRLSKRNALIAMLADKGKTPEYDEEFAKYKSFCEGVEDLEQLIEEEKAAGTPAPATQPHGEPHGEPQKDGYQQAVKAFADAARSGFRVQKAEAGTPMSEGVNADGGYAVPQDMVTRIIHLRESQQSLLDEVTVVPVQTKTGTRTFKKRTQHTGFTTVSEKGKNSAIKTPEFERVQYNIEKRTGILPVTQELMADSDANIAHEAELWLAAESRATANHEIVAEIKRAWSGPKAVTKVDELEDYWIKLGPAFRSVSKIVTNTNGIAWLGQQVGADGKKLLNEVPNKPGAMQLCLGTYTIPIAEYDNDALPNNTTKIPFLVGSLKDAVRYWDRQKLTIQRSDTAVVGELNAYEQDLVLWKGAIRTDCTAFDKDALVFCEVNTAGA